MVSVYDLMEECDKMVDSTRQKTIGMQWVQLPPSNIRLKQSTVSEDTKQQNA